MSERLFNIPINLAVSLALIIIALIVICYTARKSQTVKIFIYGFCFASAIYFLINTYWFWQNNFIGEYEITTSKINFHIKEYLAEKNTNKIIHKMTKRDMIKFFRNTSNFVRDRMEQKIAYGYDAITFADVSEHDKVFSLILLAYRHKTGYYDNLNWREPNQLLYLINPCIYNPTDPELLKILNKNIFKDEELSNEIDNPPPNVFDLVMARFATVVNSEKYENKFKIRYLSWVPFYNYQAIALKKSKDKYLPNKDCFYSN